VAFNEGDHVVFEQEEIVWLHHQMPILSETVGGKRGSFVDCRIVSGGNDLARFERHVFVCTNVREPGSARPSCTYDGKGELHRIFKDKIKDAGLKSTVRANKAGCLDQCEHGPTVVVYPDAVWYGHVTPGDVDEIVTEHLVHGRPVDRLVLAEECLNTASCPHRAVVGAK
jgi:(2Fe-2S) ferredoxin